MHSKARAVVSYLFGVGGATVLLGSPPFAEAAAPLAEVGEATLLRRTLR